MTRERQRRLALNEARVREVNETIERANERLGPAPGEDALELHILCECGTRGCDETVRITSVDYKAIRSEPTRFVVVPGHEQPAIETPVGAKRGFAIVEKFGEAGTVAELTDPEDPNGVSVL